MYRKYNQIHCYNDEIIILLKEKDNKIIILDTILGYASCYIEYPSDAKFFQNQPLIFARYAENEEIIIYPMRGMDYFLKIYKNKKLIEWVRPQNSMELKIDIESKLIKSGGVLSEGAFLLEDFISGVVI